LKLETCKYRFTVHPSPESKQINELQERLTEEINVDGEECGCQ
jgi:hypothetical protein